MKTDRGREADDELRPEYDLGSLLKGGVRGKYVDRYQAGTNIVLLEPDVARAFPDDGAVNQALRLVMQLADLPARRDADIAGRDGEPGHVRET